MLRLFVDTSVWLDLAQRRDAPRWIVPIRVLIHQGQLQLLVPPLVVEEFERNRPRVEEAVTAKVRERVRLLRSDLDAYAPDDRRYPFRPVVRVGLEVDAPVSVVMAEVLGDA
jgi:hypothetical protein